MSKKDFLIIIILTCILSLIIFFINSYFFSGSNKNAEEQYIDRSLYLDLELDTLIEKKNDLVLTTEEINDNALTKEEINLDSGISNIIVSTVEDKKLNYSFNYIPSSFKKDIGLQTYIFNKILSSNIFYNFVYTLGVDFNKYNLDVRGKMIDSTIKLFGVLTMKNPELVSVFVHEFAHYIDIYFLEKNSYSYVDTSNYFYSIAWQSTKIVKSGLSQKDFVSGYSMTNKYEDFAESLTYYILHNSDFQTKALESDILKQKYDYFGDYLFKNKEFTLNDFGYGEEIKDYYRDITKIKINLQNFLQFLQKSI